MGWRLSALLEWVYRNVGVPVLKLIGPMFFQRQYLVGRHFEEGGEGWRWVARSILTQRVLRFNRHIPWPVSPFIIISNGQNLAFHVDDLNNFQTMGCYFQNFAGRISIGRGTYVAPNAGLITANHDLINPGRHLAGSDIMLGEHCWIGMNATIMPGVVLGPHTVVGAGAVVTKSFPDGHVVLAGVPAKPIRWLPHDIHGNH
jgi:acetyltransferase-like isoleucine patch superfamily enzyme